LPVGLAGVFGAIKRIQLILREAQRQAMKTEGFPITPLNDGAV